MHLISVIVPIYNLDAYLFQCVDSIVRQTYQRLEIILVDDGSTDNAIEICEFFRKADPRIKVISKSNGGLVSARKAGLSASSGDYLFYVDGDDWISPDCIEQYYRLARQHDADIVIGDYQREFLGNFVTMRNAIAPGHYDRQRIERDVLPRMISDGPFFNHGIRTYSWGKLYRRAAIETLQQRIPDEIMVGEDAALVYPAILASDSLCVSDYALCNYRQRPNSILKSTSFDAGETERIATAFRYLAAALDSSVADFGITRQLQSYFSAILIIRSGGFMADPASYARHNIFGPLQAGARVALYNSGSFGQHVYKHLKDSQHFHLAGWYDRDFKENRLLRMPVDDPASLSGADFDHLLVPSFDVAIHREVHDLMVNQDLPASKLRLATLETACLEAFIQATGHDPITFCRLTAAEPNANRP